MHNSYNQLQDGSTAVMYACQLNHLSIANRLIEAGADFELPLEVSYAIDMNVFYLLNN